MQPVLRAIALILLSLMPATPAVATDRAAAAATSALAPSGGPVAVDARIAGDLARTRLVVDVTGPVDMRVFSLADPYRVVVDVAGLNFRLPASAGREGRGLVAAFRYGQIAPGRGRIVIDVREPVAIDKAFVLEPLEDQPARLVVDLVRTDRDSFLRAAAVQQAPPPSPRVESTPSARKSDREPPAARDARPGLPIVVIDPGHGGIDSGAIAPSGEAEKAIVLALALQVRERLQASGRVKVVLTRNDDTFVPLAERVRVARRHEAVLFLSIHADSIRAREGMASGATVYTLSDRASDAEAERLAEAENKADLIAGVDLREEPDDVADILIDLAQRETRNFSAHFARTLVAEMKGAARLHRNPLKEAGFRVLRAHDVPSVLLEIGYLSNPQELRQITSDGWRQKVAESVADAIERFVTTRTAGKARPN